MRIGHSMCPRPQHTDLTTMGSTGPCYSIKTIFRNHVYSYHTILNTKFDVYQTFHEPKTPIYRLDLYGRYRTLLFNQDSFFDVCRTFHVPKTPVYRCGLNGRHQMLCTDIFSVPAGLRLIEAYLQSLKVLVRTQFSLKLWRF